MSQARYVRLYADEEGESHFEEVTVDLTPMDFAPPAPPLQVASLFPATHCAFVFGPPGWDGAIPHPAPRRQLFCTLRGAYEITASDGATRRFSAGSVLLFENTFGKGHSTRVLEEEPALVVAVTLPDEEASDTPDQPANH